MDNSGDLSIQVLDWVLAMEGCACWVGSIEMGDSMSLKLLQKQSQDFMETGVTIWIQPPPQMKLVCQPHLNSHAYDNTSYKKLKNG